MGIPIIPALPSDLPRWTKIKRMAMFRAALRLQNIEATADMLLDLERIYCSEKPLYLMDQMCAKSPVPGLKKISARWRMTMLLTAQRIQSSYGNAERIAERYPRMSSNFPYLRIWIITDDCKRSPHAWLDGFAAKWDDSIWKTLTPPFGWDCACMIQMKSHDSIPLGLEPLQSGMERVPKDVLRAATGWMASQPYHLWNRKLSPKRPYVAAEAWPTDPARMGPSEKEREILKHYGISVTTMKSD